MGKTLHAMYHSNATVVLIMALVAWVVSGVIAGVSLRQNNLKMLELREAVFEADTNGGDVNAALVELQQYVTTTMNTSLPKLGEEKAIQLKTTYEKTLTAEQARVAAERQRINQEAANYCEAVLPNVRLTERVTCVQEYVAARPVAERSIQKDLYTFDFVSPRWSADIAGISLVIFVLLSATIVITIGYLVLLRRELRSRI